MFKTRLLFALGALFFLFAVTNCQCQRRMKCDAFSGDRAACLQNSDDCQLLTYPSCGGEKCQRMYCVADADAKICSLDKAAVLRNCPRDSRIFGDGSISAELSNQKWVYDKLSNFAQGLAGKKLTKSDVGQLIPKDREALCGTFPGETCDLKWSESKNQAVCEIGPEPCSKCDLIDPPSKCGAKNKCNDVICL